MYGVRSVCVVSELEGGRGREGERDICILYWQL